MKIAKNLLALTLMVCLLASCASTQSIDKNSPLNKNLELQSDEANENSVNPEDTDNTQETEVVPVDKIEEPEVIPETPPISYEELLVDESGQVVIIMFHNFITTYKNGDRGITMLYSGFEELLERLYAENYRTISMSDYINANIDIPEGCKPIIFTFDDGTKSQFNLIEQDGKLISNPVSAVSIMEKFYEKYPDFGLNATFYVNLGWSGTFEGAGTISERLSYLVEKGFEIGSHTYDHDNLSKISVDQLRSQLGLNQKKLESLIENYKMNSLALPFGVSPKKELFDNIIKGEYEGTSYENGVILLVGAEPADFPFIIGHNIFKTPRVRSSGLDLIHGDLTWWLDNMGEKQIFVSDGDPTTIVIPESKLDKVDKDIIEAKGKTLITY